jgi:hypothetical protein
MSFLSGHEYIRVTRRATGKPAATGTAARAFKQHNADLWDSVDRAGRGPPRTEWSSAHRLEPNAVASNDVQYDMTKQHSSDR